jgi:hypothetical protein
MASEPLAPLLREPGRDVYEIAFKGGEPAEVHVAGDGATNLDLFVFDAQHRLICASEQATDIEACRWNPTHTETFTVEVRNLGVGGNAYSLRTN